MCVSGSFGGFHYFQLRRFNDITSTPLFPHTIIDLFVQNPALVKNGSFQISGPRGRRKPGNCNYPDIERC